MTVWLLSAVGGTLLVYALIVLAFVLAGRRSDARALAGFVPDCLRFFARLLRDRRLPWRTRVLIAALLPYLALPFDLIPDFIPVAGQLDDAVIVALVLRRVLRTTESEVLRELWPGPESSFLLICRIAGSSGK